MSKITPFTLNAPTAPASSVAQGPVRTAASGPVGKSGDQPDASARLRAIEARVAILETALVEHALVLRDRIGTRLDRLEQKFRYEADGLRRALENESTDRKTNIIQLAKSVTAAVDRVEANQPPTTVQHSIDDLVSALAATRSHLDVLTRAVTGSTDGLAS